MDQLLGDYLRARRIPEAAFGRLIGVSQAAINRYATGRRRPRRDIAIKIEEATAGEVPAWKLLGLPAPAAVAA